MGLLVGHLLTFGCQESHPLPHDFKPNHLRYDRCQNENPKN